jgi:hypothetical protein
MKPIQPRLIILKMLEFYLPKETVEKIKKETYSHETRDTTFIKIVSQHFDFETLRTSPKHWQDIWVYNYLMYETKKSNYLKSHPFEIGNAIDFAGRLPRKGLIIKYRKFLEELNR